MVEKLLLIGVGAALGANARFWLGAWAIERFGELFPIGTLLVNVAGSLLLGLFAGIGVSRASGMPGGLSFLVAVGFLGSFTTFSTFSVETFLLLESGRWGVAAGNILANNLLSLTCAGAGFWLGRTLA